MKANRKIRDDKRGFSFLIPFTMAIVISVALLVTGAFVVGELTDSLESTYPTAASGLRSANQNRTMSLMGNVTEGFSDVVDIEIVVMIITGLSMAIFAIMGIGTRSSYM